MLVPLARSEIGGNGSTRIFGPLFGGLIGPECLITKLTMKCRSKGEHVRTEYVLRTSYFRVFIRRRDISLQDLEAGMGRKPSSRGEVAGGRVAPTAPGSL